MSSAVIVDTNVLVAALDGRDSLHRRATALLDPLLDSGTELLYLDVVISESIGVLARRMEEQKPSFDLGATLDRLMTNIPAEQIIWASADLQSIYSSVIDLVRQTNGVLNFNDAVIAITARRLGVEQIASFDTDFDQVSWLKRLK